MNFDRLDYQAFENIVQPRCRGRIRIDDLGKIVSLKATKENLDFHVLLRSGFRKKEWEKYSQGRTPSSEKPALSRYRNGKLNLPEYIVDIYLKGDSNFDGSNLTPQSKETVYSRVKDHFEEHLLPLLNQVNMITVSGEIRGVIERDYKLYHSVKRAVLSAFDSDNPAEFLAASFILACTRDNYPDIYVPSKTQKTEYDLFPKVERVVIEMQERQRSDSYVETLHWLYDSLHKALSVYDFPMINRTLWNIVDFWNATYEYVNPAELDTESQRFYEKIKREAYMKEFEQFRLRVLEMGQEIRKRYNFSGRVTMKYTELEDGSCIMDEDNEWLYPRVDDVRYVSYEKLWELLSDQGKEDELRKIFWANHLDITERLSSAHENVTLGELRRICIDLNCKLEDIVEIDYRDRPIIKLD